MNNYSSQLLVIVIFAIFSITPLFYLDRSGVSNITLSTRADGQILASETKIIGIPKRLEIPTIGVNADIDQVGISSKGIMDVPLISGDVGWFDLGPRPGEKGTAVIDGHLDNQDGSDAVFANLDKLKQGDHLYVVDEDGVSTIFIVQGSRELDVGNSNDVFSRNNGTFLNLITCDGIWDKAKKSYNKRLVITAEVAE